MAMDHQNTMPLDDTGREGSTISVSEKTPSLHQGNNPESKESPISETQISAKAPSEPAIGSDTVENYREPSNETSESKNKKICNLSRSPTENSERVVVELDKTEIVSSESLDDDNRLKIESNCAPDSAITARESVVSDTVERRDVANNDAAQADESAINVTARVDRNSEKEENGESTVDATNDRDESNAVLSSATDVGSEELVVSEETAESETDKRTVDRPIVAVVTASVEESREIVENKETIEETTESIEFSVIEYPEGSIVEPAMLPPNAETIELTVHESDESRSDVIVDPKEDTSSEKTDDKSVSRLVESSLKICKAEESIIDENKVTMEKTKIMLESDKNSKDELTKTEEIIEEIKDECKDSVADEKVATLSPSVKPRSVIEDIFDDWQDENPDEDCQPPALKAQDSVEMELKILLDDEKPTERKNNCDDKSSSDIQETLSTETSSGEKSGLTETKSQQETLERRDDKAEKRKECLSSKEMITGHHRAGKTSETTIVRERIIRQKPLAPRPGVKVPGFLLTSPIVSKTAVSKVLKERLREQQKDFDSPGKPDIFFVKKITQRLSHKLAAASGAQVPGLVPIPQIVTNAETNRSSKSSPVSEEKKTSHVDKELLAILEGDVDPDWSNLKPPALVSEAKSSGPTCTVEHNSPPKLDPLVERELALKQLLELPSSPIKKIVVKKPPAKLSKATRATTPKSFPSRGAAKKESTVDTVETIPRVLPDERVESLDTSESKPSINETKIDETRSGRKRKPTEKAREHEQNSAKRLKIFKVKSSADAESQPGDSSSIAKSEANNASATESAEEDTPIEPRDEATLESIDDPRQNETTRQIETKKLMPKPSAKRKLPAGQKYIRQKMPANKKAVSLKSKFPKKTTAKVISHKRPKQRNGEPNAVEAKPKKKVINEIDRLLQDEGVVNLLYDVEQPSKKRLVPITKSQTKVMDLQKIQRELKIRTKLVRNAVLRLRTSNINTSKVSPRSKRSVSHNTEARTDKKTGDQAKSAQSTIGSPTDFIIPAKIRNAADASIIIRRHSSSSFSSASASPRASIDAPERLSLDSGKIQEGFGAAHLLRSNKRRRSQEIDEKREVEGTSDDDKEEDDEAAINDVEVGDEKKKAKKKKLQTHSSELKRNRKRNVETPEANNENVEAGSVAADVGRTKSKVASSNAASSATSAATIIGNSVGRPSKKVDAKKNAKSSKQQQVEIIDVDESSSGSGGNNLGKVATRSNGSTGGGKIMGKSKKSVKCKVSFAKDRETVNKVDGHEGEDELSVCLAEAVNALSNDSGGPSRSRSTIPVNRNRTKGNASGAKIIDNDGSKTKLDTRVQFSNNEINVQRHGNLVQLLLTPSTTTKLRNGITLQVMQQLRETLSVLKKDEECRVVLVTSTGSSFCEGLELSTLLHDNKEERRLRAEELANAVKEFIKSLATFNKPIVAGVQGSAVGLGVTMLPWFDLVIASDKATFSTPYGKLGQIAEGAAIFTLSHILGSAVTSELLLGGRTLTANEALRAGLVTRVLWPDRFQAELLPSLRAMSEQSSQSMEATKALLRHSLRKKLDAALESESYLLIQHWCSAECQAAITAYVDEKIQ